MTHHKTCRLCQMPRPAAGASCKICGGVDFDPAEQALPEDFALRLISEDRLDVAMEYLETLTARGDASADVCYRLACLAYYFKDHRAVETWCHEALRLAPERMEPHVLMGISFEASGRLQEAVDELELALQAAQAEEDHAALLRRRLETCRAGIPEF